MNADDIATLRGLARVLDTPCCCLDYLETTMSMRCVFCEALLEFSREHAAQVLDVLYTLHPEIRPTRKAP